MKPMSYLIKPASSLCNMNCLYCFYKDVASTRDIYSKGIMNQETVDVLIEKALNDSKQITFAFQGGEPTLASLNFFKYFVEKVNSLKKNHQIFYSIQTNGTLLNDDWYQFFKQHHFLVGLSLDGFQRNHDKVRLKNQSGTYEQLIQVLKKLQKFQVEHNVLTVVTKQLSKYPEELYKFIKKNHIQYIQFIPCLPELDYSTDNYALTPKEFASFYKKLFDLWYKDFQRGIYVSIGLFDQLLTLFKGHAPHSCGMLGFCTLQFIIEADGSVYPCDFYALDQYKLGNIHTSSISELRNSNIGQLFIKEEKRTCSLCSHCKFIKLCHGQCKRMNIVYFNNHYCGYQELLDYTYKQFYSIAKHM